MSKLASGYAYNGNFLGFGTYFNYDNGQIEPKFRQLRDIMQITQTILFSDSAQVRYDLKFLENWLLEPPSGNFPTTHFRHLDSANVAFADGRVESRSRSFKITVPGPNYLTTSQATKIEAKRLGHIVDGDVNDTTHQDDLYDLQ